jgi:hypothetical protein
MMNRFALPIFAGDPPAAAVTPHAETGDDIRPVTVSAW